MGDLVERAAEVIAKVSFPDLWSDDHETAHRAASPFSIDAARRTNLTAARMYAQALSDAGMLAEGWRPIETAPKDGTWVQGLYPDDPWAPVWTVRCQEWRYDGDSGENWYGDHHSSDTATDRDRPTAWLPLPTPPEDA